jgi:hypothetical protein
MGNEQSQTMQMQCEISTHNYFTENQSHTYVSDIAVSWTDD